MSLWALHVWTGWVWAEQLKLSQIARRAFAKIFSRLASFSTGFRSWLFPQFEHIKNLIYIISFQLQNQVESGHLLQNQVYYSPNNRTPEGLPVTVYLSVYKLWAASLFWLKKSISTAWLCHHHASWWDIMFTRMCSVGCSSHTQFLHACQKESIFFKTFTFFSFTLP